MHGVPGSASGSFGSELFLSGLASGGAPRSLRAGLVGLSAASACSCVGSVSRTGLSSAPMSSPSPDVSRTLGTSRASGNTPARAYGSTCLSLSMVPSR